MTALAPPESAGFSAADPAENTLRFWTLPENPS